MNTIKLYGRLNLSRTAKKFKNLINDNREVFYKYFGVYLFPGSLNIKIDEQEGLQEELDKGNPPPAFIIPKVELVGMHPYIVDGQTWRCILFCDKFPQPMGCWIFRRIGSRVPKGIVEVVSELELVSPHGLIDGDDVYLEL